jgi:DNA-binding transcriptional ArsR family regulator
LSSALTSRPSREDQLDAIFHALCDRTRRALLSRLSKSPAKVTELAAPFAMSLPAVSRHIRVLEEARLVTRSVDGRVHNCGLNAMPLRIADKYLGDYREFWDSNLKALADYIDGSGS